MHRAFAGDFYQFIAHRLVQFSVCHGNPSFKPVDAAFFAIAAVCTILGVDLCMGNINTDVAEFHAFSISIHA